MSDEDPGLLPVHEERLLETRGRERPARRGYRRFRDDKGAGEAERLQRRSLRRFAALGALVAVVAGAVALVATLRVTPGAPMYDEEAAVRRSVRAVNAAVGVHDLTAFERRFDLTRTADAFAEDYRTDVLASADYEQAVRTFGESRAREIVDEARVQMATRFLGAMRQAVLQGDMKGEAQPYNTFCGSIREIDVDGRRARVIAERGDMASGTIGFEMERVGEDLWRVVRIDPESLSSVTEP